MEVSRSSSKGSVHARDGDEPISSEFRISGFSTTELDQTLWSLLPPADGTHPGHDRAANEPHRNRVAPTGAPLILLIARVGTSQLEPLRRLLNGVADAADTPIRVFDADNTMPASMQGQSPLADAVVTRVGYHEPATIAAIEALRKAWRVPVVAAISPSIAIADIAQLAAAFDDYLIEPARIEELLLRIRCLMARQRSGRGARLEAIDESTVEGDGGDDALLSIDDDAKTVKLRGRALHLTPKEFALLRLLASQSGRVFSDAEIIERLWPDSTHAAPVDVAQYIHRLRKKLNDDPCAPQWIFNIKRFGYMLRRVDSTLSAPVRATVLTTHPARAAGRFDSL